MNYISLINNFWEKNKECNFSDKEIALYFYLLSICNDLRWKNPFGQSNDMMMAKFGWGKSSLDTAKKRLKDSGLINFKAGDGRGKVYQYTIIEKEKVNEKGTQIIPLSDNLSDNLSNTLFDQKPEASINVNKTKTKKIKTPLPPKGESEEKIDFDFYVSKFNEICKSLPKVKVLSDTRKKKLKARLKDFNQEDIISCFELVEKSDFLTRRVEGSSWQASFDWILDSKSIIKIIEGNYANKQGETKTGSQDASAGRKDNAVRNDIIEKSAKDDEAFLTATGGTGYQ